MNFSGHRIVDVAMTCPNGLQNINAMSIGVVNVMEFLSLV